MVIQSAIGMLMTAGALCLAAHGEPMGCPEFDVESPRETGGLTVRAADFGFSETNEYNDVAVNAALAEARRVRARRVELAPGTYRCFDGPGLQISGFEDFTFDGKGATLVFRRPPHPPAGGFTHAGGEPNILMKECLRCEVRDLSMDWDWDADPLCDFGVIVARHKDDAPGGSWFDLFFPDWSGGHPFCGRHLPILQMTPVNEARDRLESTAPARLLFGTAEGAPGPETEWIAPNCVRVWPGREASSARSQVAGLVAPSCNDKTVEKLRPGMRFRVFHRYYGKGGLRVDSSRHVRVSGVRIVSCFGMGAVIDGSTEYCELEDFRIEPKPGRCCSCTSDGIHVARSKGHLKLTRCFSSFEGDDSLNIHDVFTIGEPDGARRLRIANVRGNAYFGAEPGARLELRRHDFAPVEWEGRVVAVGDDFIETDIDLPPLGDSSHFLVFDREFGSDYVRVVGCEFRDTMCRVIIQASHVTIEDCRFIRTGWFIGFCSAHSRKLWCEGRGAHDIVVRNCLFEHTNARADWWNDGGGSEICTYVRLPAPEGSPSAFIMEVPFVPDGFRKDFFSGILVEKCRFVDPSGYLVDAHPVSALVFRDNETVFTGRRLVSTKSGRFRFGPAENVRMSGNRWTLPPALEKALPAFQEEEIP